ncbi:hypothetical protein HBR94_17915 [Pseudomonas sp. WS 5412]|uniref:hypothetical protein n=1 Tax=Pseudomonas sp. WS 5412 TaxID=2717487 RepID=UPI001472A064|nr:hypothetical protein [Pseudomonas sp. WS 5412]NMY33382.1 hypothetical protein [Pseudomonas sp. WS 5412]
MAKPILSLKKRTPEIIEPEELPTNPLITTTEINVWDYTQEQDFSEDYNPPQRKRRKDKHVEQYRKEAKWQ